MTKRDREVKQRKRRLKASGHSYTDLALAARVSWSMAWKWMNGERKSAKIARAFAVLTATVAEDAA